MGAIFFHCITDTWFITDSIDEYAQFWIICIIKCKIAYYYLTKRSSFYPNIWKQFQSTYESLNRHILQWQLWHFLPRERADNSLKQTHKLQNEYFNAMQSIMYWMNTIAHTHTHKYVEVFDIHTLFQKNVFKKSPNRIWMTM